MIHNRHYEERQRRGNPFLWSWIASLTLAMTALIFLSACASPLPTSERLEEVKARKWGEVRQQTAMAGFVEETPAFIRIFKQEAALELWLQEPESERFGLYKTYPICAQSGMLGPKIVEGDKQAPEGFYTVGADQMNPWSRRHLSFNLGFPNEYDAALGRTGSALMIHGGCDSIGCYALTDELVEEVYLLVEASIAGGADVPVHIFPFRMSAMNMYLNQSAPWLPFWQNLKQGYDAFETTKIPPKISVGSGQNGAQYVLGTPRNASTQF